VIIPNEILMPHKKNALEIVEDIYPDDVLFIACALSYENSVIWSEDKKLRSQMGVRILNTHEMIKFLYGQS